MHVPKGGGAVTVARVRLSTREAPQVAFGGA